MVASAPPSPSIDAAAVDARLAALKAERDGKVRADAARTAGTAMGLGLKIGVELVASVIVCAAIGYGIDKVAHSRPWALLIGLMIGIAVGFRNVFRSARAETAKWQAASEADARAITPDPKP